MKFIKKFITEKPAYIPIVIISIALFAILAFFSSLYRSFNHDEFEAIHSAWKIIAGEKIYVDFLQHHHFLFYHVLGCIILLFGANVKAIIISRLLVFAMALSIAWLTYKIARLAYGRNIALLSVFFLSTSVIFLQKAIEVRPDVPLVLMGLMAVFLLLKYFKSKKIKFLWLSSLSLFISFLFLQKAVFLALLIGIIFVYKFFKKQIKLKDFFVYWGFFGILIGIFLWYVSAVFSLSEYIFLNWFVNAKLLNTFPLYKYLLISFEHNPFMWTVYFIGIFIMLRKRTFDVIAFFSIGLLGFIFLTKSPFAQYYIISLPFISIIAALNTHKIFERRQSLLAFFLIASAAGSIFVLCDAWKSNKAQLQKINYVLSITGQNDLVYDGDANFNIFRRDISYFWFSVKPKTGVLTSYQLMRDYNYNVYGLIDELKPKVVSNSFIKTKNKVIYNNYVKSEAYGDLYLRK